jgi:hypothetical protein
LMMVRVVTVGSNSPLTRAISDGAPSSRATMPRPPRMPGGWKPVFCRCL